MGVSSSRQMAAVALQSTFNAEQCTYLADRIIYSACASSDHFEHLNRGLYTPWLQHNIAHGADIDECHVSSCPERDR
jgi:hypothetical protein